MQCSTQSGEPFCYFYACLSVLERDLQRKEKKVCTDTSVDRGQRGYHHLSMQRCRNCDPLVFKLWRLIVWFDGLPWNCDLERFMRFASKNTRLNFFWFGCCYNCLPTVTQPKQWCRFILDARVATFSSARSAQFWNLHEREKKNTTSDGRGLEKAAGRLFFEVDFRIARESLDCVMPLPRIDGPILYYMCSLEFLQ